MNLLTPRQVQVTECVAKGMPTKRIAHEIGVSVRTVEHYIQAAAARIPKSDGSPRHRLTLFFLNVGTD